MILLLILILILILILKSFGERLEVPIYLLMDWFGVSFFLPNPLKKKKNNACVCMGLLGVCIFFFFFFWFWVCFEVSGIFICRLYMCDWLMCDKTTDNEYWQMNINEWWLFRISTLLTSNQTKTKSNEMREMRERNQSMRSIEKRSIRIHHYSMGRSKKRKNLNVRDFIYNKWNAFLCLVYILLL